MSQYSQSLYTSSRRYRAQLPAMRLTSLADDVLIEIASWLNIYDVLRLRRTCKVLRAVTEYHAVWHTLFLTLSARVPTPAQAYPITRLSSAQLEALTVRLTQLDINWSCTSPNPQLKRSFIFRDERLFGKEAFGDTAMLPGGRWLFSPLQREGHVAVWDLEDPALVPTIIARPSKYYYPPAFTAGPSITVFSPVPGEAVVTMTLTVNDVFPRTVIEVWRFALPNTQQRPEPHIVSLNLGAQYEISDLAIEGKLLAFRQRQNPSNVDTQGARVMDWTTASGNTVQQGFIHDRDGRAEMYRLLPNGYLMTAGSTDITICDVANLPVVMDCSAHPLEAALRSSIVWSIQYDDKTFGEIQSISTSNRIYCGTCRHSGRRVLANFDVAVMTSRTLLALHIPAGHVHDAGELKAKVTRLTRGWHNDGCSDMAGPSGVRAVWLEKTADNSTQLIPFTTDQTFGHGIAPSDIRRPWRLRVHKHRPTRPQSSITFDETIGRVCVSNQRKLTVFDFASPDPAAFAFLRHLDTAFAPDATHEDASVKSASRMGRNLKTLKTKLRF